MPNHPLLSSLLEPEKQNVLGSGIPTAAYVHIPFCRRRCYYCDFPVSIVGDRKNGENSGTIQQYVEILCQEILTTPALGHPLETVFFGGGTPSLLSVEQLQRLLSLLDSHLGIAGNAEISMEIDPGTFHKQQLQGYQKAGVNRISMGVQAFQEELLHLCGRSHTVSDIWASVELIQQVGINNFGLDLISGLPHQSLEQWQHSLETVCAIAPTHISTYDLIIEPGTAFIRQYEPGIHPLPTDETAAAMYRLAQQVLTQAGYQHYEISNYAQPGYQCCHNRVYWENRPYYGFGMGAASYLFGQRFTRPRKRREYYHWVEQLDYAAPTLTPDHVSADEVLLETLMLGLRLAEGLDLLTLGQQFGEKTLRKIWRCLQPYYEQGWVKIVGETGEVLSVGNSEQFPHTGRLRLSDPEGFLFSNTILAALFSDLSV